MNYQEQIKHPNWQKKRLEIMNRDGFTCRSCGNCMDLILHVHHLVYYKNKLIWEYDNDDLITLCEYCHEIYHNIYDKHDPTFINLVVKLREETYNNFIESQRREFLNDIT